MVLMVPSMSGVFLADAPSGLLAMNLVCSCTLVMSVFKLTRSCAEPATDVMDTTATAQLGLAFMKESTALEISFRSDAPIVLSMAMMTS